MIHTFNSINEAIIKSNHSMKRMKSILMKMTKEYLTVMLQCDASNEYYAIEMHLSHVYKTEFISTLKQFCYLKMSQDLIEDSETYIRLKNIITKKISKSNSESSLNAIFENTMFAHFMNDDVKEANTFEALIDFLHKHYFSRLL